MRPPALAAWLLRILSGPDDRRFLLDDLGDEFDAISRLRGEADARRWYWRQAVSSIGPLLAARLPAGPRFSMVGRHVRYASCLLRSSPGATAVAILTLALGIGANTAVFSVVDAVLLRPLPYRDPAALVSIWNVHVRDGERTTVGIAEYADYLRQARGFDALAGYARTTRIMRRPGDAEEVFADLVTPNLFQLLGASPALGRTFSPADTAPGANTVLLTHGFWRSHFGGDPAVIGQAIVLNDEPHTIVGVMADAFEAPSALSAGGPAPAIFLPAGLPANPDETRGDHELQVIGRLAPGAAAAQAREGFARVDDEAARRFPATNRDLRTAMAPLAEDVTRSVRPSLVVILATVGLVVLIASLNVANLLLVRALGRQHEAAVRVALGASRADIVVEFLIRGLTLAALGGAAGLVAGSWLRDLLVAAAPSSMPRLTGLALNPRVLGVSALVTVATGLIAGLVPAVQVARGRALSGLHVGERTTSGSSAVRRWQGALLAVQVGAAAVAAIAATLLVRSVIELNGVELGFQTDRVLTFRVRPVQPDPAARLAFFQAAAARIGQLPGVRSAAFANEFPMRGGWGGGLLVDGPSGLMPAEADFQAVSADYFTTLGIPLVRGRLFAGSDRDGAPPVVVVSQTFASRLMAGRDPIGVQIRRDRGAPALTIVGVVGEIRRDGKFSQVTPQVFFPATQPASYRVRLDAIAVRAAAGDPRALLPSIKAALASLDPLRAVTGVRTLDEVLLASVAARRFNMLLLTSFAALALVLAVVGVYGVVAHAALQRTREIGIRVALGATRTSVTSLIVRATLRWTVAGLALGLLAAWGSTRLIETMLFGIAPNDPITFGVVTALMLAVSAVASYLPARRAATTDPLVALRGQ